MGQIFNFLAGAQYSSSPVAVSSGQTTPLLCDAYGRLVTTSAPIGSAVLTSPTTWVDSATLTYQGTLKATAGTLWSLSAVNEGASKRWLMIFSVPAAPSNTSVPIFQIPIPAASVMNLDLPRGRAMGGTGICWVISSTAGTLTKDVAATFWINSEVT